MTTVQTEQNYTQLTLPPALILPDPNQPRVISSEEAFADLVASIAEQGILQPIQVEALPDGQYRIIAGSRRLAAAKQLGLAAIPCLVRTHLSDYERLLSQIAENKVRSDTDPYDEAVAFKTAKVLADIQAAKTHLENAGIEVQTCPVEVENNYERLSRYENYLGRLTTLMLSPEVAPQLPKEVIYQDRLSGAYRLTPQALTGWLTIEKACGVSKSKRVTLVRMTQVTPEVVGLLRTHEVTGIRQCFSALGGITIQYQKEVVETLITLEQPIEPMLLELLAETLEALELEGSKIEIHRLIQTYLTNPGVDATRLEQLYQGNAAEPDELDTLMETLGAPPSPVSMPECRTSLSTDFEERSGEDGNDNSGKGRGSRRQNNPRNTAAEFDEEEGGSFAPGGSGDDGLPSDLDATFGFTLEGLEEELPPELAAELEALGISEAAQRSIATLNPADRPKVVAMLKESPELAGKIRSIVKLMREEGYSLEAARREFETVNEIVTEETGSNEQALAGIQSLVESATLLHQALGRLRDCAPEGNLSQLPEPFGARFQEQMLLIRQMLLEAGYEF